MVLELSFLYCLNNFSFLGSWQHRESRLRAASWSDVFMLYFPFFQSPARDGLKVLSESVSTSQQTRTWQPSPPPWNWFRSLHQTLTALGEKRRALLISTASSRPIWYTSYFLPQTHTRVLVRGRRWIHGNERYFAGLPFLFFHNCCHLKDRWNTIFQGPKLSFC